MDKTTLDNNYKYHAPTEAKAEMYVAIRGRGKDFASLLNSLCPEGREKSLAMTKLEECIMWANASIARKDAPKEQG